jgi:hypothetical protein
MKWHPGNCVFHRMCPLEFEIFFWNPKMANLIIRNYLRKFNFHINYKLLFTNHLEISFAFVIKSSLYIVILLQRWFYEIIFLPFGNVEEYEADNRDMRFIKYQEDRSSSWYFILDKIYGSKNWLNMKFVLYPNCVVWFILKWLLSHILSL